MKNPKTLPTLTDAELLKTQMDVGVFDDLIDSSIPWANEIPSGGMTALSFAKRSIARGKPTSAHHAYVHLNEAVEQGKLRREKFRLGKKSMWEWVYFPVPKSAKRSR